MAPSKSKGYGLVDRITSLKNRPRMAEAAALMEKMAVLVRPIMRKHGWTLPLLAEFFPSDPNLLGMNVNRGQKILIRLRPADAPDTLYDLETMLIGTLLHELTHNVHGPHGAKFYKFLDGLQDEYDDLRSGGYSGEGFLSDGRRVGEGSGGHDSNLPMHVARQRAAAAAEKRMKQEQLMGRGGRLGGASIEGKSQREVLREAVERRLRDSQGCNHGGASKVDEELEVAKTMKESQVIDLTLDDDEDEVAPPNVDGLARKPRPGDSLNARTGIGQSGEGSRRPSGTSLTQDLDERPPSKRIRYDNDTPQIDSKPARADGTRTGHPNVPASMEVPVPTTSKVSRMPSSDSRPGSCACSACTVINDKPLALMCEVCLSMRYPDT